MPGNSEPRVQAALGETFGGLSFGVEKEADFSLEGLKSWL